MNAQLVKILKYSVIVLTIAAGIALSPLLLMMFWFIVVLLSLIGTLCFFMGLVEWAFTESKSAWEMVEFGWWAPPTLVAFILLGLLVEKFLAT